VPRRVNTVLFVCTGNQCRSPMASAILARLLENRGAAVRVQSAGFAGEGAPCPREVHAVMAPLGYDLAAHRSQIVTEEMIRGSDLVIGMTRQHLIDLSLLTPHSSSRLFTFGEVDRLAAAVGVREPGETFDAWLFRIGRCRTRQGTLSLPLSEDVSDPIGRPLRAYLETRDQLLSLAGSLANRMQPV